MPSCGGARTVACRARARGGGWASSLPWRRRRSSPRPARRTRAPWAGPPRRRTRPRRSASRVPSASRRPRRRARRAGACRARTAPSLSSLYSRASPPVLALRYASSQVCSAGSEPLVAAIRGVVPRREPRVCQKSPISSTAYTHFMSNCRSFGRDNG